MVHKEEQEIAKRKIQVLEDQVAGNENEIISQQKELIADLSKRVKLLQEEINLMTRRHHEQLMKAKSDNNLSASVSSKGSIISRAMSNRRGNRHNKKLNMTVDEDIHIPFYEKNNSKLPNNGFKIKKMQAKMEKSIEKMFSLKSDEERQMMSEIDKLGTEDLKIQHLKLLKLNEKLDNNLEAVKQEMNSKISLLRRENDNLKTQKYSDIPRPDSTFSRRSKDSEGGNKNLYYENKLKEVNKDNEEAYQRITVLENELKNQEAFFKTKLKNQFDRGTKIQEESMMHEGKFVDLMDKLNQEQSRFYVDKKRNDVKIKDTIDGAKQKVRLGENKSF